MERKSEAPKKGVVFKQNGSSKHMLIEPESFKAYIDRLPKNKRGWVDFCWMAQQPDERGVFAKVFPLHEKL